MKRKLPPHRYGVFIDRSGNPRCELVDEAIKVYEWIRPASKGEAPKRAWFGLGRIVKHGHPPRKQERVLDHCFDDRYVDPKDYLRGSFDRPCLKYRFNDKIRYMIDNYWGPVDVLFFITDLKLGEELKTELDLQTPRLKERKIR